jgi:hypothetical protein
MNKGWKIRQGLIIVFAICLYAPVDGQIFRGELIGGINFTQVEGDRVNGYKKVGLHAGMGVLWAFDFRKNSDIKPWGLSMEILYNQRGARQKNPNKNSDDTSFLSISKVDYIYKLTADYVSIPIMFSYTYKNRYGLGVGFSYNHLVRMKEIEYDKLQTYDTVGRIGKVDFNILVDVRVRLWQQLKLGFRFEYSIVPIRTRDYGKNVYFNAEIRKQYNNSLCLYLVYLFNEKRDNTKLERKRPEDKTYYY